MVSSVSTNDDENDDDDVAVVVVERSCWIGIDFGTTHSSAAVWDSTRGHAKWMRLPCIASTESRKDGRLVPTVLLLLTKAAAYQVLERDPSKQSSGLSESSLPIFSISHIVHQKEEGDDELHAMVGAPALQLLHDAESLDTGRTAASWTPQQVSDALCTNLKRLISEPQDADCYNSTTADETTPCMTASPEVLLPRSTNRTSTLANDGSLSGLTVQLIPLPGSFSSSSSSTTHKRNGSLSFPIEHLLAIFLQGLRLAANRYLTKAIPQKQLVIPMDPTTTKHNDNASDNKHHHHYKHDKRTMNSFVCRHVVCGVPAHWSQPSRAMLQRAVHLAGFHNNSNDHYKPCHVLTESSAAVLCYGLSIASPQPQHQSNHNSNNNNNNKNDSSTTPDSHTTRRVLVFDMGGGTCDVTIAELPHRDAVRVVLTVGIPIGGERLDESLLRYALQKLHQQHQLSHSNNDDDINLTLSSLETKQLLRQCQRVKERLCGDVDRGLVDPEPVVDIVIQGQAIPIHQDDFGSAIAPQVERCQQLVDRAMERYAILRRCQKETIVMDEVILVGGSTRVPAIRNMLRQCFPPPHPPDLCLLRPLSAVAEGTAIQAAMDSHCIPLHEIKSGLMLDALPYSIGVLTAASKHGKGHFVEVLHKDDNLPARGAATFELASAIQPGVTVSVVEKIDDVEGNRKSGTMYESIKDFTFLLHRMTPAQLDHLGSARRTVDIEISMSSMGELAVRVFDPNDPEHARKRLAKAGDGRVESVLGYNVSSERMTREQIVLLVLCVCLFVLYVMLKVAFNEIEIADDISSTTMQYKI